MQIREYTKRFRRKLRAYFSTSNMSATLLYYFCKMICSSLRYTQYRDSLAAQDTLALAKVNGENVEPKPVVFCLWHDELFPLFRVKINLEVVCIVSSSKDGNILSNLLNNFGFRTVKGSSRRDGLKALLSAVRMMTQEGVHACITIDGPMGPRHEVKDGAFLLAKKANARIVPVRIAMHNAWRFPSWDKFQFPIPFSKVDIHFGEGFFIADELNDENLKIYRKQLEDGLAELAPYKD